MTGESAQKLAERRSQVYWLLSRFYLTRPETAFLREVHSWLTDAGTMVNSASALELLRLAVEDIESPGRVRDLGQEYTRLLRGLQPGYGPPPPYESVYRTSTVPGAVTVDVVRCMREAGFGEVAPEVGPQDHLGAELKFMSLLCYRESQAWGEDERPAAEQAWSRQKAFLDEHVLNWVPEYCKRLEAEAGEPFYRGVALLTGSTVVEDRRVLEGLRHGVIAQW